MIGPVIQMKKELLEKISVISEEEKKILDGDKEVDYTIYSSHSNEMMDRNKLLPLGHQIGMRPHTRFIHFPPHKHNYFELIYMCKGTTTHIIDRKDRIVLTEGSLLLLNQNESHEILPAGKDDIALNFIILPQFFDAALPTLHHENPLWLFLTSSLKQGCTPSYLAFFVKDVLPVQNLMENLTYTLCEGGTANNEIERQTVSLLLQHLSYCTESLGVVSEEGRQHAVVMRVLRQIEENYRNCSLAELAEKEGMSDSALSRLILGETGVRFTELLHTVRFQRAAYLLRETDLSVSEITNSIGYENASFFYRNFSKHYGCTPNQYREKSREQE